MDWEFAVDWGWYGLGGCSNLGMVWIGSLQLSVSCGARYSQSFVSFVNVGLDLNFD
jgi:hypothetical protein